MKTREEMLTWLVKNVTEWPTVDHVRLMKNRKVTQDSVWIWAPGVHKSFVFASPLGGGTIDRDEWQQARNTYSPADLRLQEEVSRVKPSAASSHVNCRCIQSPLMSKYDRKITGKGGVAITVDVYAVLEAFSVTDAALQHLIKKALCTGIRGHKSTEQDLKDILDSATRAYEMYQERNK